MEQKNTPTQRDLRFFPLNGAFCLWATVVQKIAAIGASPDATFATFITHFLPTTQFCCLIAAQPLPFARSFFSGRVAPAVECLSQVGS